MINMLSIADLLQQKVVAETEALDISWRPQEIGIISNQMKSSRQNVFPKAGLPSPSHDEILYDCGFNIIFCQ